MEKKIIFIWALKAIVKKKVVARSYALEFSHLPHASFSSSNTFLDWSDRITEEVGCVSFYSNAPQIKEAIANSKKFLLKQIESNKHLLDEDLDDEKLIDIICSKLSGA